MSYDVLCLIMCSLVTRKNPNLHRKSGSVVIPFWRCIAGFTALDFDDCHEGLKFGSVLLSQSHSAPRSETP